MYKLTKFFLGLLLFLLLTNVTVYAYEVPIYDGSVEQMIKYTAEDAKEMKFSLWGKEYYTHSGEKWCRVYFGDSKNNCIYFKLNGNKIQKAWICISVNNSTNYAEASKASMKAGMQAGIILGAILFHTGLTEDECIDVGNKLTKDYYDAINQDPLPENFSKEYSVWCSATARQMHLNVKGDNSGVTYYIYASDN